MKKSALVLLIASFGLVSCHNRYVSTIVSTEYSAKVNKTVYTVVPFGTVGIPGEWTKMHYDSVSKQQFFMHKAEDVKLGIAFGPLEGLPGRKVGESTFDSLKNFYMWDADYLAEKWHGTHQILKIDIDRGFLVWELKSKKIDETFLFGSKGQTVSAFVISSPVWKKTKKIEFLEELYLGRD